MKYTVKYGVVNKNKIDLIKDSNLREFLKLAGYPEISVLETLKVKDTVYITSVKTLSGKKFEFDLKDFMHVTEFNSIFADIDELENNKYIGKKFKLRLVNKANNCFIKSYTFDNIGFQNKLKHFLQHGLASTDMTKRCTFVPLKIKNGVITSILVYVPGSLIPHKLDLNSNRKKLFVKTFDDMFFEEEDLKAQESSITQQTADEIINKAKELVKSINNSGYYNIDLIRYETWNKFVDYVEGITK